MDPERVSKIENVIAQLKSKPKAYEEASEESKLKYAEIIKEYKDWKQSGSTQQDPQVESVPTIEDMTFSPEEKEKYVQTATGTLPVKEQPLGQQIVTAPARGAIAGAETLGSLIGGGLSAEGRGEKGFDAGETFQESFYTDPSKRSSFGQIVTSPEAPAILTAPYQGVSKAVGSLLGGAPKLVKGVATGLAEGAMEETISEGTPIGLGTLASGVLGGAGGKLLDVAEGKFRSMVPKKASERFEAQGQGIKDVYENLPTGARIDYDIPAQYDKVTKQINELGTLKKEAYKKADEALTDQQWLVEKNTGDQLEQGITGEIQRLTKDISEGKLDREFVEEYADELTDIGKLYFKRSEISPHGIDSMTELKEVLKDSYGMEPGYHNTLTKLWNARVGIDDRLRRFYKKNPGAKVTTKEEASIFARRMMNDTIEDTLQKARKEAESQALDATSRTKLLSTLDKVEADLAKAGDLPSKYRQQEVLGSLGGAGGVQKNFYDIVRGGGVKGTVLPPSGIRERQLGKLMTKQPLQSFAKDAFYREQ
jgi:hypothetical protein